MVEAEMAIGFSLAFPENVQLKTLPTVHLRKLGQI
jgi:hypothetical protein